MLPKINLPDFMPADALHSNRRLMLTLLLSLLLLLSACQVPFIGSDSSPDALQEVQSTDTETVSDGTEDAEGEVPSIFNLTTPETAESSESSESSESNESTEPAEDGEVAAADAGESTDETASSADSETTAEGAESTDAADAADATDAADGADAVEENTASTDSSTENEGESGASDANADGEEGTETQEADAQEGAESGEAEGEGTADGEEGNTSDATDTTDAAETTETTETTETAEESTATEQNPSTEGESSATEASSDETSATSSTPQVQVTADSVQVHDGPGPYNPVVGTLAKENVVEVLGRNIASTWYYVKVSAELNGWIPAESTQGVGSFSADQVSVLKAPAIPAPTATPEPTSTSSPSESAPTATQTTESAPSATPTTESAPSATPTTQSSAFIYGIQAHLIHIDRSLPFANTTGLGFGLIKQQIEWKEWEKTEDNIDWSEMDAILQEAAQNNLNVLYSVVGAPDWAREAGFDGSVAGPPADPATFASFLGQMATRYCGQNLSAIEVWNEQNLHYEWGNQTLDPAAYMALLKPSYDAIKAACPAMTVVSGALTPAGDIGTLAIDDFTYLQGMFDNGLANAADVVGAHPSGYNVPPSLRYTEACDYLEQKDPAPTFKGPCDTPHHSWSFLSTLEGYRDIIQQNGSSQKIWATEFGWAAGGSFANGYEYADDNSLDEQAQWSVEAFQYMRNTDYVEAAILWNLNFRMVADGTEKAQWGILANNSQPLPAFIALQAMEK